VSGSNVTDGNRSEARAEHAHGRCTIASSGMRCEKLECLVATCSAPPSQAVRRAMRGFALPDSAIPSWAKTVPEDAWRPRLTRGDDPADR
jgi:hypothetical protein